MGGWLRAAGLVLVFSIVGGALPAFAQKAGKEPPASTRERNDEVSEARALFMAGRSAFDEGRYEAALKYFQTSYEQSHHAALLYNVGQCYDRLRRDEEAIAAFERYLSEENDADNRAPVEARVRALREIVAARQAAARETPEVVAPSTTAAPRDNAPKEDTPAPGTAGEQHRWLGPTLTMGAGAAAGIVGAVLMVLGNNHNTDVENAKAGSQYRDAQDDADRAGRQWIAGQVTLGVGAAALVGGLTWWLVQRRGTQDRVAVSLSPTSVGLRGRF